jgi:NRAMP (natural resistance-associated macrophage protein)-like metal ion transporter
MSVSYLDPGNLEADIQVGVQTGYSLLWWYATCAVALGFLVQCLAGQLGLVTGQDLAQHCGKRYPKPARWLLWVLMEIAIVGADIQETIGSAIAIAILSGGVIPLWAGCILISVTAFMLLLLDRCGFRQLEIVFALFILVEAVSLGINFFQAGVPAGEMFEGLLVPTLNRSNIVVAVGALGALVMPYNIFFQSSVVNARPRDTSTPGRLSMLLVYMRLENMIMLIMAFIINVFVVCVFAEGFYDPTADPPPELGLETAGEHLAERFGGVFKTMWAIGLLASGQVGQG